MVLSSNPSDLRLLTVAETANVLRVSRSLVYQLVESGRIGSHRLGNGRGAVRIRMDEILRYVESCRSEPVEAARMPPRRRETLKHLKL